MQQNRSIYLEIKTAFTDIDQAKTFNKQFTHITPYSPSKINWYIDHRIKILPTKKIRLTITHMQLAISNSTNNNSTAPDGTNIRHCKHLGPLAIRYPANMYNTTLNTNTIPHLWKHATIISISKPN